MASDSRKENFGRIVCAAILAAVAVLGLTPCLLAQEGEYERADRSLADLMKVDDGPGRFVPGIPRSTVDEAKASKEGIRKIAGRRLILFTDLPYDPLIEELPEVFDQAFPVWCKYFSIDPASHATWQMTGFLMKDGDRFRRTGLLPRHLPPFRNGFSVNYDLWLYEQETPYYRRDLLLHDGVSTFYLSSDSQCLLEALITCYQENAFGAPDTAYLYVNTPASLSYLAESLVAYLTSKFPRHKLADDGGPTPAAGMRIATPSLVRAEVIEFLTKLYNQKGLVEHPKAYQDSIVAERDESDRSRVNILLPVRLIGQLRRTFIRVEHS